MSDHLLILPHLRVQNANAISGPLTWGFPAMTAFIGLMHALERRCRQENIDVHFKGVGVVCHQATPQTTRSAYGQHSFQLTRNPLKADGSTAAIVAEGRMHLELSLLLKMSGTACEDAQSERCRLAAQIDSYLQDMRIAGGSVLPRNDERLVHYQRTPVLMPLVPEEDADLYQRQLRSIKRRLLPGFALILRENALVNHLRTLQGTQPNATLLEAWLDLSRFNYRYHPDRPEKQRWALTRQLPGWIVPIPIGYSALSDEMPADAITNARDPNTPLRFVEPLFSIGEWRSPHRFERVDEMLWRIRPTDDERLFLLDMWEKTAGAIDDDANGLDAEPEQDPNDY